jgi:anti-anti-sigma factor
MTSVPSSELTYRFETENGCCVIALTSALNSAPWNAIETVGNEILDRLGEGRSPAVLFDLTELEYIGSATVALMVRVWKTVQEQNGAMVVVNRHEPVHEVLRMAGLVRLWTIVGTKDEALRELRKTGVLSRGDWRGPVLLLAALAAVIAGGIGLWGMWSPTEALPGRIADSLTFFGGTFGLCTGGFFAFRGRGTLRSAGIGIAVIGLAIVAAGTWNLVGA